MSVNTTPATFTASEIVPSSKMNTEIRDFATGVQAAWDAYTPVWTAVTTNPTMGATTLVGAWRRIGKTIDYRIIITIGAGFAAGSGGYRFSLPVATTAGLAGQSNFPMGTAHLLDSSAPASYMRHVAFATTGTVLILDDAAAQMTNAVPFIPAAGDKIMIAGRYEAA